MSSDSLYQHYLEYLLSPPVLLTLWILLVPFVLERYKDKIRPPSLQPFKPAGCYRLGLRTKSNLADQYDEKPGQPSTSDAHSTGSPTVKAMFTYPLKSCRGVELTATEVGPTGLKYDRLFTFAQLLPPKKDQDEAKGTEEGSWKFMTQRDFPKLALLQIQLFAPDPRAGQQEAANGLAKDSRSTRGRTRSRHSQADADAAQKKLQEDWVTNGGCVVINFPHLPAFNPFGMRKETIELRIPLAPTPQRAKSKMYTFENVSIWKDYPMAINMINEIDDVAHSKLAAFLGVKNPLALFRVSDRDKRAVTRSLPQDRPGESYQVGFADAFPINILNLESVRAVDCSLPPGATMKDKLDCRRFRANIYVTGVPSFAEDNWKRVHLGRCLTPREDANHNDADLRRSRRGMVETIGLYHVACRTARCTLPNTDPNTGVKDRNEPYSSLKKTRVVDEGAKPHSVLGLHMIPLFREGILRVGDVVEVLERGENVYEKMFPG